MKYGFVYLHRKIFEHEIFKDDALFKLFIYCFGKANHEANEFIFGGEMTNVERGSFIVGRFKLSEALGWNPNTTYKRLRKLQKIGLISLKSNNKNTMITVLKYDTYQNVANWREQQSNNKVTTKEQQSNNKVTQTIISNKDNNEKKEQGESLHSLEACLSVALYEGYSKEEGQKFFDFYNSQGWKRGKSQALITDLVSAFRSWISRAGEMGITPSKAGKLNQTNL